MPLHVSNTCAHHQEVKIALRSIWYHHTYRFDDTRGCVMQFWPPDDEHMCSKHVEAWNKLIVKQKCCASSWLITYINTQLSALLQFLFLLNFRYILDHSLVPVWWYQRLGNAILTSDDEHMCSKHVETWNKLTVKQKFCATSWLITEINSPRCTVNKTTKKLPLFPGVLFHWS